MGSKGIKAAKIGIVNQAFPAIAAGTTQVVATSASNAQSAALGSTTNLVRVVATQACYLEFSGSAAGSPVATASTSVLLPANAPEYFAVVPGTKLGALRVSADGSLFITEAQVVS
jgi:hypothetical protein